MYEKSAFCVAGREVIVINSRGGAKGCDPEACDVGLCVVEVLSSFLRPGE